MWGNLKNKSIILGSKSPRRNELLKSLGIDFKVQTYDFDESYDQDLAIDKITDYLVRKKASNFELKSNEILIVCDTLVVNNNQILEKPKNKDEAFNMLNELSGNSHLVYTSLGIKSLNNEIYKTDSAKVFFNELSSDEINFYVDNFLPFDKAGSYGIQEWIGFAKIAKIEGSFFTIMGLPTAILYEELKNNEF